MISENRLWQITYSNSVPNDIARLDHVARQQVAKAIQTKLMTQPNIFGKPLRKPKQGQWSLRVGDYRVIYIMDDEAHAVRITAIGHRRDIYD